jgi:DNA-binding transcriptional LysR family regulator
MDDWNSLRLVLAISRRSSLTGAAQELGVNHSTAFRRLNSLEEALGVRLFERLLGGVYAATAAGERAAAVAERMETETAALDREILGRDRSLTGRLRVTSSETLAFSMLTKQVGRFREAHPGIAIELVIDNRVLSLSRREADIAMRVNRPKEGDLFGRKLADVAWTVYGTPELAHGTDTKQLESCSFIGWEEGVSGINVADWMAARLEAASFVYRTNSVVNQLVAARLGMGLAVLPCYLGDLEPGLVRVIAEPIPELVRELWMVTHSDLKTTARVRAFFEVVGGELVRERALISGSAGGGEQSPRTNPTDAFIQDSGVR